MKEDEIKRLIEKYKEGNTTLNEEQFLFNHTKDSVLSLEAWSNFIKNNKKETPTNFNATLWESFQNKKIGKRKRFVRIISAAASVILLISFYIASPKQKGLSYSKKEDLLNQALNMVSNSEPSETQQNIIYENEMVIIYTTSE
ncbi:hypothetical protein LY01_01020 [Nonlabens xylanidelens]|uniref:Uncharacterized protein n=1 Tax=Nonlabens xylanidelens TaxID=191564 RepID=A0A2S6IMH9_9FLAO|nr:hypothetical protein [Nonlabens xylanidelens]PPK95433.1 hypothetical protein LY01_01020 [Nonlabens xylanidelens]PQJ22254.1 hypothetical protein BST94_01360 [Nonlabens xylanidelens]